jgi:hypothetical protein
MKRRKHSWQTALQPAPISTALLSGTGLRASRPELGAIAITAASYPAALTDQAAIGSICLLHRHQASIARLMASTGAAAGLACAAGRHHLGGAPAPFPG